MRRPVIPSTPAPTRDHVRPDKGKAKASEGKVSAIIQSYTTRGIEKKLLGDAMKATRQEHISKKRSRKITFV